jgi:predicted MFS family arabinose efflux permease
MATLEAGCPGPAGLDSGRPHRCRATQPAPFTLGRRASFWVSAGVVGHTFWTSAAPAMTYPLYAEEWQLSHATITAIFALYPLVVVAVLVGFGDLSDHIGRRATMLLGLAASLLGVLLFAAAPSVAWLFAGRAFMGLGVGLAAGPSTAAVVEFSAPGRARLASSITTAAQAVGFVAALLLGGALVEYAPLPTRLSFLTLSAVLAVLSVATWFLPRRTTPGALRRWRPRTPSIPQELRPAFAVAAIAVTTAYTHGVLILSLGAQLARDLIGSNNAFVNGAALSLFAILSGVVGIVGKSLPYRRAIAAGAIASAAGMALLAMAVAWHDLRIFLAATATSGMGYSLLFLGGLDIISGTAPVHRRGGVLSALYLLAYLSLGVVALLLGELATAYGLGLAIDLGAGAIAVLSAATIALVASVRIKRSSDEPPPAACKV